MAVVWVGLTRIKIKVFQHPNVLAVCIISLFEEFMICTCKFVRLWPGNKREIYKKLRVDKILIAKTRTISLDPSASLLWCKTLQIAVIYTSVTNLKTSKTHLKTCSSFRYLTHYICTLIIYLIVQTLIGLNKLLMYNKVGTVTVIIMTPIMPWTVVIGCNCL